MFLIVTLLKSPVEEKTDALEVNGLVCTHPRGNAHHTTALSSHTETLETINSSKQ